MLKGNAFVFGGKSLLVDAVVTDQADLHLVGHGNKRSLREGVATESGERGNMNQNVTI